MTGAPRITEFLLVAFPKALTGFGTIVFNLILLRALGAEQFGVVSICVTSVLLVDAIIGSAIDLSVMKLAPALRPSDPEACKAIQRSALYLKAAGGIVLTAPLILARGPISQALFRSSGYESVLGISALAALALLILRSAQAQMQIESNYRLYGMVELLHAALRFGGVAAIITLGLASPLAVMACISAAPLALVALWLASGARGLLSPPAIDLFWSRQLVTHLRWSLLTFGLGALISRLDLFILARWAGLAEVGLYSAALTLAMMAQLAGTYIAVVTNPRVGPMMKEGRLGAFYWRFQLALAVCCVAGYACFHFLWSMGANRLLPAKYAAAGDILHILLLGTLAGLATFPLTLTCLMFMRPRFLFFLDCVTLPGILLAYYLLVPGMGALGAAYVTAGANLLRALIAQAVAWHLIYLSPSRAPEAAELVEVNTPGC